MALFAQAYEASYSQLINNSPLFWPFIVGSLVIAACIYFTNKSETIKSPAAFVAWLFPKKIYAHRSAISACATPTLVEPHFISPLQHQVHHSCLLQHRDKNFGGVIGLG